MTKNSESREDDVNPFSEFLEGDIPMEELQRRLSRQRQQAPMPDHVDPRLIGTWRFKRLISGGGTSFVSDSYFVLALDGSFVKTSHAISSTTFLDSMGNWAGVSSVGTGVSAGERGSWSAGNGQLRMDYEDNTYTEWEYQVIGDNIRCFVGGDPQTWQRV